MPEYTSKESAILANMSETLLTVELAEGKAIAEVLVVRDPMAFARANDPLRGVVLALAPRNSGIARGVDADQPRVGRLIVDVVIKAAAVVDTAGNTDAHEQIHAIAEVVRAKLLEDPLRGATCSRVTFGGQFIDGTSTDGDLRWLSPEPANGFVCAAVPVVCGFIP